jgi:hypothetical protein
MQRWAKNYGFAFLLLAGLVGSVCVAATTAVPDPVPDFALQAEAIYRLEIGAAFFAVFYLVTMAMVLALDGRGFAEIGTKGLKAQRVVNRASARQQQELHRQWRLDSRTKGRLDEHETRLEKLEARLID